jgi:protein-tyrosine phosphatase
MILGDKMIKVLFVCLGNICRSPMAEGLFKKLVKDMGYEECFHIESRGTSNWELGNPPHPGTIKILSRLNISTDYMSSEKIESKDFKEFDYIIGMDHDNINYLYKMGQGYHHKIHLYRDVNPNTNQQIIPDPYHTGKYEETYQLLDADMHLWFERMIAEMKDK